MSKLNKVESVLLFLTLLFLPTQLGRHFWPDFSYIFSLKVDYLSPTIYFWDLLVVALLILWRVKKGVVSKLALNLFLLFLLTQALSLFSAKNLGAGLVRLEQYTVALFLGVYLASQKWAELKRKIFLPLFLGILFESSLAILQFMKGSTLGFWILGERSFNLSTPGIAKFNFYGLEFLRPYGTFPHPNVLAGYFLVMVYSLWFIVDGLREKSSKLFKWLVLIAGATIVLTVSRVAILAGFVMALVALPKKWKLVLMAAALILSPILFTRFEALFSYDKLTFLRREGLSIEAWQMFLNSPVLGVGLNNFIPAEQELVSGPSRFLQPVHNIFLLALAETGLIGLMGLISLIGFPLLKSKLYPILFLGLFDHYFLTLPQGYRLLFLIWGLSLSFLKLK